MNGSPIASLQAEGEKYVCVQYSTEVTASMIKTYIIHTRIVPLWRVCHGLFFLFFVLFSVNFLPGLAVFIIPSGLIHLTGVAIIKIGYNIRLSTGNHSLGPYIKPSISTLLNQQMRLEKCQRSAISSRLMQIISTSTNSPAVVSLINFLRSKSRIVEEGFFTILE